MRVATRSLYQGIQQRLLQLTGDLKKINEKITSGKNLNRPSDDPAALIDSLGLKATISQTNQYQRNLVYGESCLKLSESAISQTLELVNRAQEIAIQMASDTQSAETRAHAATEVGHLLDQAIALGNTRLGGTYLFSGYKTGTAPFLKTTVGEIETAGYGGDQNDFEIQIGKEERLIVRRNGQTVFMDSGLFDTLGNLKKALEDNDRNGIGQQLANLKGVEDYLNNQIADVGARANRLDGKSRMLTDLILNMEERLSTVEDTDMVRVIVELKQKELAYEAALLSSVRITELSLLNYLR